MSPLPLILLMRPVRPSNYFSSKYQVAGKFLKPFDLVWKKRKTSSKVHIQDHISSFDERFDDLFFATSGQKTIRQVRDSEFLNWRYRINPRRKYTTYVATDDDGKLQGYIIIRMMEIFGKRVGLIIDLLTQKNSDSGQNLIVTALNYFWANNAALAIVTCFSSSIEYQLVKKVGFFLCPKRFLPHPLTLCLKPSTEELDRKEDKVARSG